MTCPGAADSSPRSNLHLSAAVPPLRHWHVNSHRLLSELSSRERNLRRMLQGERAQRRSDVSKTSICGMYLALNSSPLLHQNPSTRSPSWRSCSLTPAQLPPKLARGSRRGNTMRLSRRAARPAQPPTICLFYSCTTARSPSPPTGVSALRLRTPPTASLTTLTLLPATAESWAPLSITWWVWGPVTTRCSCRVSMASIRLFPLRDLQPPRAQLQQLQQPAAFFFPSPYEE